MATSLNQKSENQLNWRKPKDSSLIDYEKLDTFIDLVMSKYKQENVKKELYDITGDQAYFIINNNSLIPDLVIFNKTFNKNLCYYDFKGNAYNPYPRKKLKIENFKSMKDYKDNQRDDFKDKDKKDIYSNYGSQDSKENDPDWADTDVNDLNNNFEFCRLPPTNKIEEEKDELNDFINNLKGEKTESQICIEDDFREFIREDNEIVLFSPSKNDNDNIEENKNKIEEGLKDEIHFDIHAFIEESKPENENNDFDLGYLSQMANQVYSKDNKCEKSEDASHVSIKDESIQDMVGIRSILGDDGDCESLNNSLSISSNVQCVGVLNSQTQIEKDKLKQISNLSNLLSVNSNNNNNQDIQDKPLIPINQQYPIQTQTNPSVIVPPKLNTIPNPQQQQQQKMAFPSFQMLPPHYIQCMSFTQSYMMYLQFQKQVEKEKKDKGKIQNKNVIQVQKNQKDIAKERKCSFDIQILDDPINIIYKNTMGKYWFVELKGSKMMNLHSYELYDFLEQHVRLGKDIFDVEVHDYQTDMYFSSKSLLENLREVIPQLKAGIAIQLKMNKLGQQMQIQNNQMERKGQIIQQQQPKNNHKVNNK